MTLPLLPLLLKMMIAAGIVVGVSVLAERARPFLAAMVMTLPVSAGPSLVFLALDHDDAFLRATLESALVANLAICAFVLAYVHLAQRHRMPVALAGALLLWAGCGALARLLPWSLPLAMGATIAVFAAMLRLVAPFTRAGTAPGAARARYALLARAGGVAVLVGLVTGLGTRVGPYVSAFLATFPIVLSSLIVILHPRIGGPATAGLIAATIPGLFGFGAALAAAAVTTPALGRFAALALGLGVALAWNGALTLARLRRPAP